jgi:pimeloyl-ACP methyl ester carboxylesterase
MSASVRRAYLDGPFGQVHYRRAEPEGEPRARPLVGFHQSPLSSRMYEPFLAQMGTDRRALALDTPGYGESDPPPRPLSIAGYAEAHGQVLDALGIGEVDLVGIHTGSRMAVELALQRPRQVRHLLLVGASVYNDEERASQRRWTSDLVRPTERDDEGVQIRSMWQAWSGLRWDGLTDEMLERCLSDQLRNRSRAFAALEAVFAHDLGERLPLLEQPTLVVNVRDDIYEACKRAEPLLQHGRLVDLSPAGFGVVEAWPERIAELARDHFDA